MSLSNSQFSTLHSPLIPPGYKQTEVGVIPEEWDAGSLGRFWSVTDCKHVTADFVPDGFPIASIKEVQSRFVELTNAKQTTQHFYNLLIEGGRKPQPGDLIISRNATVGEIAQVAEWHPPFAMGQDVCLLRKKAPEFSTDFIQAVFQSRIVANQLSNLMVGSTFKRANVEQIRNFSVPMPPLPEQRAIAEALRDVNGLLGGLDRLIAKKRDLKQAAMQQLLTGQTRLPGFHGEWEVKRLGEVVDTDPENLGSDTRPDFLFNYIALEDVDRGFLRSYSEQLFASAPSRARRKLRTNDVFVSTVPPNLQSHLLFKGDTGSWVCSTGFCVVRCREGVTHPGYVFFHLFADCVKRQIDALLTGSNYPAINSGDVRALQIPIPEYVEQTTIAEVLTDMDLELAALEQRREKTRTLKQAMMQELLTGKTRLING
ncbi:MAG: restriction endonuclease subunit S [Nitrospira sp.]|nr:restriction endonuclease subunit S [Nitrospira sp.]